MDNAFAILMLIFGAVLLLYGISLLLSGNYKLLPLKAQPSLKSGDKEGQTKRIGKITAIVALCPLAGGLIGLLFGNTGCLIGMLVTAAVCIAAAILKKRKKQ